ncbi:MAG TPA: SDR family oxidoreductase [Bryobacteraceae bacterium]|nr:SDR family oxidoreductase [Bryobacteraceae bacterium]
MQAETTRNEGPWVLVTGASSGIGAELAKIFAAQGYSVALAARSVSKLEELAAELANRYKARSRVIQSDLGDPDAPPRVYEELGKLGIALEALVNNAGFGLRGFFAESDTGRLLEMMQVNMTALTHLTRLFLPGMIARRSGRILNVASTAGFVPGPTMAVYYASKAYVVSLTEALANELSGTGVSITALCPGPTHTGFAETAGTSNARLFKRSSVMDAASVARIGFEGLMAGKTIVIPGLQNRIVMAAARIAPRKMLAGITRGLNSPE